jgi:hypothetical protein
VKPGDLVRVLSQAFMWRDPHVRGRDKPIHLFTRERLALVIGPGVVGVGETHYALCLYDHRIGWIMQIMLRPLSSTLLVE